MSAKTKTPSESWFADGAHLYEKSEAYGLLKIATFSHPVFPRANDGNAEHAAMCIRDHARLLSRVTLLEGALESALMTAQTERHPFRPWQDKAARLLAQSEDRK